VRRFTFVRSSHSDTYDEEFMTATADAYEHGTRHSRMRLANVQELVDPKPGDRVLDLGCATGAMAHFLSTLGARTVGADSSAIGIKKARMLFPEIRFEIADAAHLPFEDRSFDKVLAADLTEHLDQPTLEGMFSECYRILVPGGTLSIHTPNPRHIIERLKAKEVLVSQNPTHIGLRTREQLETPLQAAGFELEVSNWRRSFIPAFRQFELVAGRFSELFRYRICIRARKPSESGSVAVDQ
jgi:ubiquinone/menaquinone biosynthesis C-methylase UbiE